MNAQFSAPTPGPWRLHADGLAIFGADGQEVIDASVCSPNIPHRQQRANARLITLAPQLLDLVRQVADWQPGVHQPQQAKHPIDKAVFEARALVQWAKRAPRS